jgi:hypothetical protein
MFRRKKLKLIFLTGILAVAAVATGFYALGQTDTEQVSTLPGKLEIEETQYNFGTIGLDNVSHIFMVKNIGPGPLTIERVSTSCGCTTAQLKQGDKTSVKFGMEHGSLPRANKTLEPGEEIEVVVTYNPLAHGMQNAAGSFRRIVYIQTSNPKEERELTVEMTVAPNLGRN